MVEYAVVAGTTTYRTYVNTGTTWVQSGDTAYKNYVASNPSAPIYLKTTMGQYVPYASVFGSTTTTPTKTTTTTTTPTPTTSAPMYTASVTSSTVYVKQTMSTGATKTVYPTSTTWYQTQISKGYKPTYYTDPGTGYRYVTGLTAPTLDERNWAASTTGTPVNEPRPATSTTGTPLVYEPNVSIVRPTTTTTTTPTKTTTTSTTTKTYSPTIATQLVKDPYSVLKAVTAASTATPTISYTPPKTTFTQPAITKTTIPSGTTLISVGGTTISTSPSGTSTMIPTSVLPKTSTTTAQQLTQLTKTSTVIPTIPTVITAAKTQVDTGISPVLIKQTTIASQPISSRSTTPSVIPISIIQAKTQIDTGVSQLIQQITPKPVTKTVTTQLYGDVTATPPVNTGVTYGRLPDGTITFNVTPEGLQTFYHAESYTTGGKNIIWNDKTVYTLPNFVQDKNGSYIVKGTVTFTRNNTMETQAWENAYKSYVAAGGYTGSGKTGATFVATKTGFNPLDFAARYIEQNTGLYKYLDENPLANDIFTTVGTAVNYKIIKVGGVDVVTPFGALQAPGDAVLSLLKSLSFPTAKASQIPPIMQTPSVGTTSYAYPKNIQKMFTFLDTIQASGISMKKEPASMTPVSLDVIAEKNRLDYGISPLFAAVKPSTEYIPSSGDYQKTAGGGVYNINSPFMYVPPDLSKPIVETKTFTRANVAEIFATPETAERNKMIDDLMHGFTYTQTSTTYPGGGTFFNPDYVQTGYHKDVVTGTVMPNYEWTVQKPKEMSNIWTETYKGMQEFIHPTKQEAQGVASFDTAQYQKFSELSPMERYVKIFSAGLHNPVDFLGETPKYVYSALTGDRAKATEGYYRNFLGREIDIQRGIKTPFERIGYVIESPFVMAMAFASGSYAGGYIKGVSGATGTGTRLVTGVERALGGYFTTEMTKGGITSYQQGTLQSYLYKTGLLVGLTAGLGAGLSKEGEVTGFRKYEISKLETPEAKAQLQTQYKAIGEMQNLYTEKPSAPFDLTKVLGEEQTVRFQTAMERAKAENITVVHKGSGVMETYGIELTKPVHDIDVSILPKTTLQSPVKLRGGVEVKSPIDTVSQVARFTDILREEGVDLSKFDILEGEKFGQALNTRGTGFTEPPIRTAGGSVFDYQMRLSELGVRSVKEAIAPEISMRGKDWTRMIDIMEQKVNEPIVEMKPSSYAQMLQKQGLVDLYMGTSSKQIYDIGQNPSLLFPDLVSRGGYRLTSKEQPIQWKTLKGDEGHITLIPKYNTGEYIELFHGTTKENAAKILTEGFKIGEESRFFKEYKPTYDSEGFRVSSNEPFKEPYISTTLDLDVAKAYGNTVLSIKIPKEKFIRMYEGLQNNVQLDFPKFEFEMLDGTYQKFTNAEIYFPNLGKELRVPSLTEAKELTILKPKTDTTAFRDPFSMGTGERNISFSENIPPEYISIYRKPKIKSSLKGTTNETIGLTLTPETTGAFTPKIIVKSFLSPELKQTTYAHELLHLEPYLRTGRAGSEGYAYGNEATVKFYKPTLAETLSKYQPELRPGTYEMIGSSYYQTHPLEAPKSEFTLSERFIRKYGKPMTELQLWDELPKDFGTESYLKAEPFRPQFINEGKITDSVFVKKGLISGKPEIFTFKADWAKGTTFFSSMISTGGKATRYDHLLPYLGAGVIRINYPSTLQMAYTPTQPILKPSIYTTGKSTSVSTILSSIKSIYTPSDYTASTWMKTYQIPSGTPSSTTKVYPSKDTSFSILSYPSTTKPAYTPSYTPSAYIPSYANYSPPYTPSPTYTPSYTLPKYTPPYTPSYTPKKYTPSYTPPYTPDVPYTPPYTPSYTPSGITPPSSNPPSNTSPSTPPSTILPYTPPTTPYPPTKVILPMNLNIRGKEKKHEPGYDVYVKDRTYVHGKQKYHERWKKANPRPLTHGEALSLGATAVDQSAAASFKVTQAEGKPEKLKIAADPWFMISDKFYKKKGTYIETTDNRIDSSGEIKGISALGWIANQQKLYSNQPSYKGFTTPAKTTRISMPSMKTLKIDYDAAGLTRTLKTSYTLPNMKKMLRGLGM